jgi:hypothetical protein
MLVFVETPRALSCCVQLLYRVLSLRRKSHVPVVAVAEAVAKRTRLTQNLIGELVWHRSASPLPIRHQRASCGDI